MPIRITSKKDGFWRCGVQHFPTPTVHPDDRFTRAAGAVKAEPMLIVDVTAEEKPKAGKRTDGKGEVSDDVLHTRGSLGASERSGPALWSTMRAQVR